MRLVGLRTNISSMTDMTPIWSFSYPPPSLSLSSLFVLFLPPTLSLFHLPYFLSLSLSLFSFSLSVCLSSSRRDMGVLSQIVMCLRTRSLFRVYASFFAFTGSDAKHLCPIFASWWWEILSATFDTFFFYLRKLRYGAWNKKKLTQLKNICFKLLQEPIQLAFGTCTKFFSVIFNDTFAG